MWSSAVGKVKRMKEERQLLALKLALRDKQEQQLQTSIKNKADEVRAREEDTAKELRRALQSTGLLKETARRQHQRRQGLKQSVVNTKCEMTNYRLFDRPAN